MKDTIFIVMPMFVCLFWSVMLTFELHADGRNRPRLHLLIFMVTATLLYFGHYAFFTNSKDILPITDTIYVTANLAVYPLFYLYICSLATHRQKQKLRWILLIPAVAGGLAVGTHYVLMNETELHQFIELYLYDDTREGLTGFALSQAFIHDVCKVVFAILMIPVIVYGRHFLQEYEKRVHSTYADVEDKTLVPVNHMLIAFLVTSVASFGLNLIGRHQFVEATWLLPIPSLLFSILLFAIGYIGYKQRFSMENLEADELEAENLGIDPSTISETRQRIEQLMEQELLFRQPNLRIIDIVQRLGSNRNYVYQAVNIEMGMSFNEYVNRMRIDYAAQLMSRHPNKSLSEIAEQSGFSSNSSFYRNFKLYKDVGPKEFLNDIRTKQSTK